MDLSIHLDAGLDHAVTNTDPSAAVYDTLSRPHLDVRPSTIGFQTEMSATNTGERPPIGSNIISDGAIPNTRDAPCAPCDSTSLPQLNEYPPIEELDAIISVTKEACLSTRSRKLYAHYQTHYKLFCEHYGLQALPATTETVLCFFAYYALKRSPKTVKGSRSAIAHMHWTAGYASPTQDPAVDHFFSGDVRLRGAPANKKMAVNIQQVRAVCLLLDQTGGVASMRTKSAALTAYGGAFRVSEIVSLQRRDVTIQHDGLEIQVRKSKTDQTHKGCVVYICSTKANPATDPRLALLEWLEIYERKLGRPIPPTAPLYPALQAFGDKNDLDFRPRMTAKRQTVAFWSPDSYRDALKTAFCTADPSLSPEQIGGHSTRSAHATESARNGARREQIAETGRWTHLQTLEGYIRRGRGMAESSSNYIGL